MFARIPSASWVRWGRSSLVLALCGLPLYASCTTSEDTEPFVPAGEGPRQGRGDGDLLTEEDACPRLMEAFEGAYDRLRCDAPTFPDCPSFIRPGGGSGCYEYPEDSIAACEQSYDEALTCEELSPCAVTAIPNTELPTCELIGVVDGVAGAGAGGAGTAGSGGSDVGGASAEGGAPPTSVGGSPTDGGMPAAGGQGGAG